MGQIISFEVSNNLWFQNFFQKPKTKLVFLFSLIPCLLVKEWKYRKFWFQNFAKTKNKACFPLFFLFTLSLIPCLHVNVRRYWKFWWLKSKLRKSLIIFGLKILFENVKQAKNRLCFLLCAFFTNFLFTGKQKNEQNFWWPKSILLKFVITFDFKTFFKNKNQGLFSFVYIFTNFLFTYGLNQSLGSPQEVLAWKLLFENEKQAKNSICFHLFPFLLTIWLKPNKATYTGMA